MIRNFPATPGRSLSSSALWLALAALQTGVIAGCIALLYLMLDGLARGDGPWVFLNLLGATFYPRRAFSMSFSKVTVSGLALHVFVSGVTGILFAAMLMRFVSRPLRALWLGSLLGVLWYYVIFRYLWAQINPAFVLYQPFPGVFLAHMVFGFCMGLYPRFLQRLALLQKSSTAGQAPSQSY